VKPRKGAVKQLTFQETVAGGENPHKRAGTNLDQLLGSRGKHHEEPENMLLHRLGVPWPKEEIKNKKIYNRSESLWGVIVDSKKKTAKKRNWMRSQNTEGLRITTSSFWGP